MLFGTHEIQRQITLETNYPLFLLHGVRKVHGVTIFETQILILESHPVAHCRLTAKQDTVYIFPLILFMQEVVEEC